MSDPVPAISEAAATGETAEIFADIRAVLGVDVVNLIWRHLATLDGGLPWAWGMLRPLYVDGTMAAEAALLHEDLDVPRPPVFPPEVLEAAGLRDDDMAAIRDILAAYDRTNAMALVALSALLRSRDDLTPGGAAAQGPAATDAPGQPPPQILTPRIRLPPLPILNALPPPTAQLVLTLNRLGTRRDQPVLASMYRHLAYWPGYLALTWTLIAPLDGNRVLHDAIASAVERAGAQATRLALRLRDAPSPPPDAATVRAALEPFVGDVIAKMVVICATLRAATGGPALRRMQ